MLATTCTAGTPVVPSLSITSTGAENGKMLKIAQTTLLGNRVNNERAGMGAMANMPKTDASRCVSRTVGLTCRHGCGEDCKEQVAQDEVDNTKKKERRGYLQSAYQASHRAGCENQENGNGHYPDDDLEQPRGADAQ